MIRISKDLTDKAIVNAARSEDGGANAVYELVWICINHAETFDDGSVEMGPVDARKFLRWL